MQSLFTLTPNRILLVGLLMFSGILAGFAQESKPLNYTDVFDKKEVMIPARDGIKLHTEIYTPTTPAVATSTPGPLSTRPFTTSSSPVSSSTKGSISSRTR